MGLSQLTSRSEGVMTFFCGEEGDKWISDDTNCCLRQVKLPHLFIKRAGIAAQQSAPSKVFLALPPTLATQRWPLTCYSTAARAHAFSIAHLCVTYGGECAEMWCYFSGRVWTFVTKCDKGERGDFRHKSVTSFVKSPLPVCICVVLCMVDVIPVLKEDAFTLASFQVKAASSFTDIRCIATH